MKSDRLYKSYNLIGIILMIIGAGVLLRTTCLIVASDIWFDELFTVELASMKIPQLLNLAAKDVHPPLYYIYVRGVFLLLRCFNSAITAVTAAKISALLPYVGIIIYACVFVRRRFGWISAGLLVIMATTMPQLSAYMVEARMYSVAMFTVFAMFIHGMEAICGDDSDRPYSWYIHLSAAVIYGIISMYLHYYAFIGAAAVALCMFVYVLINRDSGAKRIWSIVASMVVCLLSYIPWLKAVTSQVGQVSASYWIQPVSVRTLAGCVKYIFKPEFETGIVNYVCVAVMVIIYGIMLTRSLIPALGKRVSKEQRDKAFIYLFTFAVPVVLVLIGFVASLIIRPVFVYRYMLPVMAVFWMGYACLLGDWILAVIQRFCDKTYSKKNGIYILHVIILCITLFTISSVAVRDYKCFTWEEQKKIKGMSDTDKAFEMIREEYPDELLVCNFNQVQDILWFYLDNPSVLWGETDETLIADICGRAPIVMTDSLSKLPDSFLYIGSGNVREEIISDWTAEGKNVELIADSCLLERYYFNIYLVN